jgi:DNA-binding MarR family transcriptional regulator
MKSPRNGDEACPPAARRSSAAFLLAQVGAHAASAFADRLTAIKLTPAHAGILRILDTSPAMTQQALAAALKIVPSRLVALLDELETKGLTERRENPDDRRSYAVHLTEKGRLTLKKIGEISREHQRTLLAVLSDEEQRELGRLLQRVADEQGLTAGVHPGYSKPRG